MSITRRSFFSSIAGLFLAPKVSRVVLGKSMVDWIPVEGIPYTCTNASTGSWLGFDRANVAWMHPSQKDAYDNLAKLVHHLEINRPSSNVYIDNISVLDGY